MRQEKGVVRMPESLNLDKEQKRQVPDTPEARIAELMKLPLKNKASFVPPPDFTFRLGPHVYRVSVVNAGQLRFTAKLVDVIIQGVNDGSEKVSDIIDPKTGEGAVKG